MLTTRNKNIFYCFLLISSINSTVLWADQSPDEIQKRFNAETISKGNNFGYGGYLGGYVRPYYGGYYGGGYYSPYYGGW